MSVNKDLVGGTLWTAVGRYSNAITQLVTTAILSRILSSDDFGIVAMIAAIVSFTTIFAQAGTGSAVVQQDLEENTRSTLFWFNSTVSVLLTVTVMVAAPLVATFYQMPELASVTVWASLTVALMGIMAVPLGVMRKDLRFKDVAITELFASLLSAIVAVYMAYDGYGYWALVVQAVMRTAAQTVAVLLLSGWRPRLVFEFRLIGGAIKYSRYVTGFQVINYWARNADNILIGRFLGPAALGVYGLAYSLMTLPLRFITGVIDPVMHPVFATIQTDIATMREGYLRVVRWIAFLSIPMALGMWVAADLLVQVIWGQSWSAAIPGFRVLSILAALQPVVSTTGIVFMARNRTSLLFYVGAINAVMIVGGFIIGLRWGVLGVAGGYVISYSLIVLPTMYVVIRLLEGSLHDLGRVLKAPVITGIIVASAEKAVLSLVAGRLPQPVQLITVVLAAGSALVACLYVFEPEITNHLLRFAGKRLAIRPKGGWTG